MQPFEAANKQITVMGLGLHGGGIGVVRWLAKHGAQLTVTDLKSRDELASSLKKLKQFESQIEYVLGEHRKKDFTDADVVIKGQGVPSSSEYLQAAKKAGVEIETDIGIFVRNFPGKIIGVTGTKGKTTTTTLLHEIISSSHADVLLGGNIRQSPLDDLDEATSKTVAVLELSSFQLEIFKELKFSPHIAVWTNLYPDHLDRYDSMEAYAAAKSQIMLHQKDGDTFVASADDKALSSYISQAPAATRLFSVHSKQIEGTYLDGDKIVRLADGKREAIGSHTAIKVPGRHNMANVLAAIEAARTFGVPADKVKEVVETFKGVANRLEVVRTHAGITYVNDTASTIPISAAAGMESFAGPLVLIAGGSEKHLPFDPMVDAILSHQSLKAIILFDAPASYRLAEVLRENDAAKAAQLLITPYATSMKQAVKEAKKALDAHGTVLLSPGSASFGMFVNEFDRGDQFIQAVKEL